jgi:hypothetical protein
MSSVLTPPETTTFQSIRQPETTTAPKPHGSGTELAQMLCGAGLVVYGLLRGSWPGLTLAAVGGFLIYRGLAAPPLVQADRCPRPPQDDLQAGAGSARPPSVALSPIEREPRLGQDFDKAGESTAASPPSLGMEQSEELTHKEHVEAELAAYYRALRRGAGYLPTYDHTKAVEDFCWAAEMVFRERVGG